MEKQAYKPRRPGLGIKNWLKRRTAVKSNSMWFGEVFFKAIVASPPFTRFRPLDILIQKVALLSKKHHTAGYSIPLNVDVADKIRPVTLPVDVMKKTVAEASYRALLYECLCRRTFKCKDYPRDLGCLFLGEAAKICVANGIAREATVEECNAHIDRAAKLGLAGHSFWVEVEEYVWGIQDKNMQNYLELCFCCPCCCAAFRFEQKAHGHTKTVLHHSAGWVCTVGKECVNCGACVKACPRLLITQGSTSAVIAAECSGCGICINSCPQGAHRLEQKTEMKKNLADYFVGVGLKI